MAKVFSKIIDSSLEAVNKVNTQLSDVFKRFSRRKITVQTEVNGVEKVDQAKQKIESLPKQKTVELKVEKKGDLSGLGRRKRNSVTTPAKTHVNMLEKEFLENFSVTQ